MSTAEIFFSVFFFTLLGMAWVVGYDFVKKHSPAHLPQFYFTLAAIRMILSVTVVAIYHLVIAESRAQSLTFAAWFMIMNALMMVVTLIYKH